MQGGIIYGFVWRKSKGCRGQAAPLFVKGLKVKLRIIFIIFADGKFHWLYIMKRVFFIFMLLFACGVAVAQQKGKVFATVIDSETKEGVMGAVVEVGSVANPDDKRYYTTGYGGKLEIPALNYGEYKLIITFLGYNDLETTIKVSAANQNLGNLEMVESSTRIDTVVKEVKSMRTSQYGDTLSYNAGAFKVANDADVEGLLKKMPGITITNGTVEAQGETIQKVFVDGKEFFGEDVNTAIQSLPAQAVERIEVYNKLSDEAEFSGMDDGEGYKALNIVTRENMRNAQFGKIYAGYGYQPETDAVTSHHKYTVGGNVNFFRDDSRISVIGLFNNINQQNFSFEDILGVSGNTGGGRPRGVGQYMVRPQDGVALVNSIGLNYSDTWGKKDQVKFQGSYFFNNTDTKNLSSEETWYESPSPVDTLLQSGNSRTINNNHRLNARIDWRIAPNHSLMSRTSFSYQGNNPIENTLGYKYGESGLSYIDDYSKNKYSGWRLNEFLQYRVRLGKAGRTMTVDGRINYNENTRNRYISSNNATSIPYSEDPDSEYWQALDNYREYGIDGVPQLYDPIYQYIHTPSRTYTLRGNVEYNEPIAKNMQVSLQYRISYESEKKDQRAYYTDSDFNMTSVNDDMTNSYESGYMTHRIGPGYRYSKNKNTFVANVYYQNATLDGRVVGGQSDDIRKNYNNVLYFAMLNYMINRENSIRVFFRSYTDNPSVTQLQTIFDVSTPQYLSVGNKNLNPSYTHSINFHYINSNVEKGRTFMWMAMMRHQQNYISTSTWYNSGTQIEIGDKTYTPQQITSYENMDGYWFLRTHLSLGLPLSFMKCNLNLMFGVDYTVTPSAIYGSYQDMLDHVYSTNYANNIGYDANVTLGSNISENIDFTLSWNGTYNQAWNTAASGNAKNNYFSHTASGNLKWVFWKGFTFTASCSYVQYIGFTTDYNESYVLCNLYLGKKLFRNQLGEIQIGVNDVANQNTAFVRNTGSGYTQNMYNSVIGRYFSIQFVYNLRSFGKRGSKNMNDYDYRESKGGVGMGATRVGPPMPPRH